MKKTKKMAKAKTKPVAKKTAKPTSKTKTKRTKKAEKTHILAIIDKSGSMGPIAKDAMGGFNTFLAEQKKLKDKATMNVVLFSNPDSIVSGNVIPLKDVEELTPKNYIPEGSTALNDAIVQSMTKLKLSMNDMKKSQRPDKVLVIMVTDGDENASREYPKSKVDEVRKLINLRKEENWQFMFLCSTEDTALAGEKLGISKGNTFQFTNDSVGNTQMYAKLSFATSSFRGMSVNESDYSLKSANLLNEDEDTANVKNSVSASTDEDEND